MLDRVDLGLPVGLVRGLVGRFDVREDQVVLVEHRGRRLALAGVVGVVEAGHALDFVHVPAEQHRQARGAGRRR